MLRELSLDGTYLIREGRRAGAEKVLSVWQIDRCRHYKLFKDDVSTHFVPMSPLSTTDYLTCIMYNKASASLVYMYMCLENIASYQYRPMVTLCSM